MGVAAFTGLGGSFPVVWVADFTGIRSYDPFNRINTATARTLLLTQAMLYPVKLKSQFLQNYF
jgi:hypothetical protein